MKVRIEDDKQFLRRFDGVIIEIIRRDDLFVLE